MIVPSYNLFRAMFAPGASPGPGGWEAWPGSSVIYPPGEAGFNLRLPTDLTPQTVILSVNSTGPGLDGADDATPWVDEFDWYVSQRTEIAGQQPLNVRSYNQAHLNLSNTKSGTIYLSPLRYVDFSLVPPAVRSEDLANVYRDVFVYVRRRSNGHIMWGGLLVTPEGAN
jgi:hypothetical protein